MFLVIEPTIISLPFNFTSASAQSVQIPPSIAVAHTRKLHHTEIPTDDDCLHGGFDISWCLGFVVEPDDNLFPQALQSYHCLNSISCAFLCDACVLSFPDLTVFLPPFLPASDKSWVTSDFVRLVWRSPSECISLSSILRDKEKS